MAYTPKPNTGTLWPNEYKKAENQPDKRGDLLLDRALLKLLMSKTNDDLIKITISGWTRVINGKDCLSIAAAEPYVKPAYKPAPEDDSDIPF